MKKMNDIVLKVIDYFTTLNEDTEISTGEALKIVLGFDQDETGEYLVGGKQVEFEEMFKLDLEIRKEARKAGMIIDDSLYADMVTGLPFHIPYLVKTKGHFYEFIQEDNPEQWEGFPELMWGLGFEMDCYESAPKFDLLHRHKHTEKEIQDQLLQHMQNWDTQEVGNYIFSRYRELTHWSDYGYPEERAGYFFKRAFIILQEKLGEEWEDRHCEPEIDEFSALILKKFSYRLEPTQLDKIREFIYSDEGQYHIKTKYNEYMQRLKVDKITLPMLRGRCVTETAKYIEILY